MKNPPEMAGFLLQAISAESVFLPVLFGGAMSARPGRRAGNQLQQVRDQELGLLDLYAQTAQESSTVQEMPETARNFLEAFAQDGAVPQNVYVSAQAIQETFFQEENADLMAAAAEMGITPESLQENLALGADVAIPFAKAATGIFADQERYNALREQMRLSPESLTSAQVQEAANIEQDAASRQAYLDTLLEPFYQRQQADEAVQERRAEIAKPYVEQLMQAGYSEEQAGKYGQVLAAHAEQMAPIKGQTPQEYLQEHFAGYRAMTQADFEAGNIGFFQEDEREYIREDFTRKNDEDTARVITLPESAIPQMQVKDFSKWVINLLAEQGGDVVINSTGQTVQFTNKNINASTKRSSSKRKGAQEHREAFLALREMVANAEYWKSRHEDERHEGKGEQDLYTSALNINGKLYSVILAFDKHTEQTLEYVKSHNLEIGDLKYKDHKLAEIIIAPALYQAVSTESAVLQHEAESSASTEAINEVSLGILRGSVKPSRLENNTLRQNESGAIARGAMATLQDGRHFVALFEKQNASTVIHETGHFFLEELRDANALTSAPAWVHEAWQKLENAYGFSEWDIDRAGWVRVQERFARDFEAYCREGKAPSPELQSAFSRFRKWLTSIYKSVRSILGENQLNEDVRQVFDRLLATEEEIAESRRAMEDKSALNHLPGVPTKLMQRYQQAIEKARKSVDAAFANRRLVERRQAEKEIREQAAIDIDQSQTYQEIAALREQGISLDALKQIIDKDFVNYLRGKWRGEKGSGKGLIRKGGSIDLMEAAARLGYDNVQALAYGLGRLSTRREAIEELVGQRLAEWDANYDVEVEYSAAYDEFLAQQELTPFGEPITAPQWLLDSLKNQRGKTGVRFSSLSLEQMRDVQSLVRELAQAGRNHGKMLAAGRRIETQAVADFCAAQMDTLSERHYISERDNFIAKGIGRLREFLSDTTAIRFLARAMDGFQDHGINHDSWFNPLQQAQSRELVLRRAVYDKIRSAIMPLMANSSQITKAFAIDDVVLPEDVSREWGGMWDMDKVFSVALNMGNEGNINALMGGYKWSAQDLQKITSRLTEEQWQAVQNIWDAIDSLYPELTKVYQELKGAPLPKVKSKAFSVTTAEGKTLRLKGGYYPLLFDQRFSKKAAQDQSVDEMLNGMENIVRSPNPQSGMTRERKGGKLPPKLSLAVLDRHVTDTVHYITHALPLRDANSLFNNQTFKDAFINHAGLENYNKLLPWLRGIARPDGERMAAPVRALQYLANRGATYALGASFRTALLQLTSVGNSINEVGAVNFLVASSKLLLSPVETYTAIRKKSAYMQARANLFDDTMRKDYEAMQAQGFGGVRFKGVRYSLDTLRHAQMGLMISMDAAIAAPTWLGAYESAVKSGLSEEEAIARADGAVVAAQGGGGALDTPYVMRQSTWLRVICPFMSFAMSDFNRKMFHVRGIAEWAKSGNSAITPGVFLKHFALEWALPVFLTCMLTSLGRDGDLPEMQDYFWEALTFYTMGIPIVRDAATMARDKFSSSPKIGSRSPQGNRLKLFQASV